MNPKYAFDSPQARSVWRNYFAVLDPGKLGRLRIKDDWLAWRLCRADMWGTVEVRTTHKGKKNKATTASAWPVLTLASGAGNVNRVIAWGTKAGQLLSREKLHVVKWLCDPSKHKESRLREVVL